MAGFNIAELSAIFEAKGAQNVVQDIGRVQSGFTRTGETATKAGAQVDAALGRMSGATSKYRELQLRNAAAQERFVAALNATSPSLARIASAEASVIASNRRLAASNPAKAMEATTAAAEAQVIGLSRASAGVVGFMDSMAKLGIGLAGFEAVVKGIELVKSGSDFQKQMLQIQTMAGASAADVKTLSKAVLGLAGEVAASPEDLAKSLYHVEQNSHGLLTTAQMLNVLKVGAEGAKVGLADVEDTTNAMTIATASGIKGVQNMSSAMGTMLAIAGTGDMRLSDLTEAMGTGILSIAKQFGATLNDVAAVLATLGDNGIRGVDAAQGLRQVLMGMADPAARGADSLALVGLKMHDLADDMEKHGLVHAMNDLNAHMEAAGITGNKVGSFITDVFGRRAGKSIAVLFGEMDRVNAKAAEGLKGAQTFASRWDATTKTAAFGWERLGAAIQAGAISAFEDAAPAVGRVGQLLADDVPKAAHVALDALAPFVTLWRGIEDVIGPVEDALSGVGGVLGPIAPEAKAVASAVLSMWLAFKGYQIARVAVQAVADGVAVMSTTARNGLGATGASAELLATDFDRSTGEIRGALYGTAADSRAATAAMQADMARLQAETLNTVAAQDRATAMKAQALSDEVAASSAATDAEVANADRVAAAALAQAKASADAARASAAAAETAAADIDTAGTAASAGWRGVLGPIGLAAIGVMTLVSMFHKSTDASKEATDAANAYADALKTAQSPADILTAIIDQLKKDNVAAEIDRLNSSLGHTAVTGPAFASAIADGGRALDDMRSKLEAVIKAGSSQVPVRQGFISHAHLPGIGSIPVPSIPGDVPGEFETKLTPAAQAASKALAELNKQYLALSDATKKDLQDTKTWAGVSSAIQTVSQSTKVATTTAGDYAQMLGIYVDKNGVAAASAGTLTAAVDTVSRAYNTASMAGNTFLAALKTFSTSGGTAADRGALIAATLVAGNGDLLAYAGSLASASAATTKFGQDVHQAASQVGKSGESAQSYLASLVNLKTGTIDYRRAGAGPLIQDLQSMQSAAMNAAQATFQHARATESGKRAAADAYNVYKAQTSGALVDEAQKLGLTAGQAQRLADKYFGMPKKVKTLIEQEGANPVVDVLNQIGQQLSYLTGHKWKINTDAQTQAAQTKLGRLLTTMHQIGQGVNAQVLITTHNETAGTSHTVKANAKGTNSLGDGYFTVGEQGYELGYKRGSNVQIFDHAKSVALTGMRNVPGYADGTAGHIGLGHALGGTKVSALLSDGGLGTEWITKLSLAGKQLVATFLGITASLQRVRGSSISAVSHSLAGAVAPDPTTAQGWQARLAASQKLATVDREQYEIAKQNVQALNQRAAAADRAAKKAQNDAEAMKSSTKAEKAAKDAAEAHAKTLQTEASAVDKLASKAKSDFDKIKSASAATTQKMQADAQSLVAALQADEQAVEQNFTSLSSTIAQGLSAGGDLATMFGGLTSNVDSAQQALDAANSALQQATVDTSGLAAAQQQVTAATAAQAAAHAQLTKALAGGDASAILAAQQAQTTAAANLAAAQAAVTAATPTPDQLAAQAQAQQQVVAAQQALTAAQKAATASGAAGAAAQFAASESQFSGDLTTLANKLGKSPAAQQLITQLAGMGAAGGDALAQGLINDPKSRKSLLASMSAISAIANTEGDALAQGFYGAGIKSIEKLIEGIEKKTPSLTKALAPILAQLAGLGGGTSYMVKKGDTLASILNAEYGASKNHPQLAAFLAANPELAKVGHTASLNKFAGTSLSIPSFAKGVTDWPGGLAYVHGGEVLVNMPRGSNDVIPANQVKNAPFAGTDLTPVVTEIRALRGQVSTLADDMGQVQARVGAGLYVTAGSAHADKQRRAYRKGAL